MDNLFNLLCCGASKTSSRKQPTEEFQQLSMQLGQALIQKYPTLSSLGSIPSQVKEELLVSDKVYTVANIMVKPATQKNGNYAILTLNLEHEEKSSFFSTADRLVKQLSLVVKQNLDQSLEVLSPHMAVEILAKNKALLSDAYFSKAGIKFYTEEFFTPINEWLRSGSLILDQHELAIFHTSLLKFLQDFNEITGENTQTKYRIEHLHKFYTSYAQILNQVDTSKFSDYEAEEFTRIINDQVGPYFAVVAEFINTSFMSSSHQVQVPTLYRGFSQEAFFQYMLPRSALDPTTKKPLLIAGIKLNVDRGYTSTSEDPETALNFACQRDNGVVLIIKDADKGNYKTLGIRDLSKCYREEEVLLPPNLQATITKVITDPSEIATKLQTSAFPPAILVLEVVYAQA